MIHYISNGNAIDSFSKDAVINFRENGEEYRFFGKIIDVIFDTYKREERLPIYFGNCSFGRRFTGKNAWLSREQASIPGFPDFLLINDEFALCFEHFRINASSPRSSYHNGTEYNAFLERHKELVAESQYEVLEEKLVEEKIIFSRENLSLHFLYMLDKKISKIPGYLNAAKEFISGGPNKQVVKEDLSKQEEVWFLVEDNTPTTDFASLFTNDAVTKKLKKCKGLDGIVYVHSSMPNHGPSSIDDIVFIHNDQTAWNQIEEYCKNE